MDENTSFDNDIKNELIELANQVTQTFSQAEINNDAGIVSKYESFKDIESNGNDGKRNDNELFDNDEFKLPEVDWDNLEAKLKQAKLEIDNQVIIVYS